MTSEEAVLVLSTFPDRARAEAAARAVVGEGLAACVNILGDVRSIYTWQGAVQEDSEVLCVIKTTRVAEERLRARLLALHPYEVPEVIALPIVAGHEGYLRWLAESVR